MPGTHDQISPWRYSGRFLTVFHVIPTDPKEVVKQVNFYLSHHAPNVQVAIADSSRLASNPSASEDPAQEMLFRTSFGIAQHAATDETAKKEESLAMIRYHH